ncbi:pentapeptide repeat-containing protein [Desulfovibrio ferrophilus]|uniref:Ion transport 2 domain protein n=1 Tax=Desulfovibrio ferrophilus TaxID=241368 RepID=A0A2Z6AZ07_9BACT|nr:pentapeptide repeat-containing protein [Desulfovibrio ferrophilus]BBD08423.1 ion transport 2 domain protein [Desulfovibrio ferrophilus]
MANPKHLEILLTGVTKWNKWRDDNPHITPDLSGANLQGKNLQKVNFQDALIGKANLKNANLDDANLQGAYLAQTNLKYARLWNANLQAAELPAANLEKAEIPRSNLKNANLSCANLKGADMGSANLKRTLLMDTRVQKTNFRGAQLDEADVRNISYKQWGISRGGYRDIELGNCHGSQQFRRFAMDQDFIEEFRVHNKHWRFWLLYIPWLILCDCGRSFMLWLGWCIAAAVGFAFAYEHIGVDAFHLSNGLAWNFDTLLYYSTVTITTLGFGDVTPITAQAKHWVMAEVILGYILLGGLISIMSTKLTRRSG